MVVLYLIEPTDAGLIAALRAEGLPAPDAGRYFSADHHGAVVGYVGLEGEGRDLLVRSLVVLADRKARGLGARVLAATEVVAGEERGQRRIVVLAASLDFRRGRLGIVDQAQRLGQPAGLGEQPLGLLGHVALL